METNTRAGALRQFTSSDYVYDDENESQQIDSSTTVGHMNDAMDHANTDLGGLRQHVEAIEVSDVLIFNNEELSHPEHMNTRYDKKQGFIVENETSSNNVSIDVDEILPEEKYIRSQTWSCYGNTVVDYLELENIQSGKQKRVAVSPRTFGINKRNIEAEDQTIMVCGIGTKDTVFTTIIHDVAKKGSNHVTQERRLVANDSVTPTAREGSGDMFHFAKLTYQQSTKIMNHMKENAIWFGRWFIDNVRDDFPSRTYHFGSKVVQHIPNTIHNVQSFVTKVLEDSDDSSNEGKK